MKAKFIEDNERIYRHLIQTYNVCNDELVNYLDEMGLFYAPASTMSSLHNAFQGGLVDHLIRVATQAIKFHEVLHESIRPERNSLVKVAMLHGIGKVGLYSECTSDWHRKNQGKMYEFNNDLVSMTVGERSVYLITKFNNKLTEEEFQAIVNYEKDDSNVMAKWHTAHVGKLLQHAIYWAIMLEKEKFKNNQ